MPTSPQQTSPDEAPLSMSPRTSSSKDRPLDSYSPGVYFGPLQSPEKRFLSLASRLSTLKNDLRVTSLRLSTTNRNETTELNDNANADDLGHVDDQGSPNATSEVEHIFLDEPSSALVDRIIRAQGNPSPPPGQNEFIKSVSLSYKGPSSPLLIDISAPPTPCPPTAQNVAQDSESALLIRGGPNRDVPLLVDLETTLYSPLASLHIRSPSPSPGADDESPLDLISFDAVVTSAPGVPPNNAGPSTLRPSFKNLKTIDDILSNSPSPASTRHPLIMSDDRKAASITETLLPISPLQEPRELLANANGAASPDASEAKPERDTEHVLPSQPPSDFKTPFSINSTDSLFLSAEPGLLLQPIPRRSPRRSTTPLRIIPSDTSIPTRKKGRERSLSPLDEYTDYTKAEGNRSAANGPERDVSRGTPSRDVGAALEVNMDSGRREDEPTTLQNGLDTKEEGPRVLKEAIDAIPPEPTTSLLEPSEVTRTSHLVDTSSPVAKGNVALMTPRRPSSPVFRPPGGSASLPGPSVFDPNFATPSRIVASPRKFMADTTGDNIGTPARAAQTAARRILLTPTLYSTETDSHSASPDVMQSPRRVPANSTPRPPPRLETPVYMLAPTRSASEGPSAFGPRTPVKPRFGSAEPAPSAPLGWNDSLGLPGQGLFKARSAMKLPFPITAPNRPAAIAEEGETPARPGAEHPAATLAGAQPGPPPSSPAKSALRQPSTASTSRIPRIGAKPYARPMSAKKEPFTSHQRGALDTVPKGRIASAGDRSSNNVATVPMRSAAAPLTRDKPLISNSAPTATAKRKRETSELKAQKQAPVVVLRQVPRDQIPVKFTTGRPRKEIQPSIRDASVKIGSSKGPSMSVLTPALLKQSEPQSQHNHQTEEPHNAPLLGSLPLGDVQRAEIALGETTPPASPTPSKRDNVPAVPSRYRTMKVALDDAASAPSTSEDTSRGSRERRRTTRPRKPASSVSGTLEPRPVSRRKASADTRYDGLSILGLSSVALKALTSSNTVKNQQYVAAKLETEVVRVGGTRPDSPVIKIRTISQKQMEEMKKSRQERAERRARKSLEWQDFEPGERDDRSCADLDDCFQESSDDDKDVPLRHRRGPGDEEGYETPDRAEQFVKRARFGESEEEVREKKRVKWDRGLWKAVYLDEIQLGGRTRPVTDVVKKGCLAPSAKTQRLDTLGNLLNTDSPLGDIVHESIVVKKFVYDSDLEAPAVNRTRSKSKKAKS